jgi:NAD(P)-dependent dehydrogenase (short-subunit alcohol dehydrogenase family)
VEAAKAALPGIEVLVSDAGNVAATKALVDQVEAKHGRIDVLFVNAGIAKFAPIAQVAEAFYDSQFNINVKGAFFLIKHAIPIIPDGGAKRRPGKQHNLRLDQGGAAFIRPHGIRVSTISPGPIITPILDKGRSHTGSQFYRGPRPAFRLAAPAPQPKSPQRPSISPSMRLIPPAPNCSSMAA